MKKVCVLLLCLSLLLGGCSFAGEKPSADGFSIGVGGDLALTVSDGGGTVEATWAAVTLDGNGRILHCAIDAINIAVSEGDLDLRSKNEKKEEYGMVAWAGAEKEWYEQAAIFCEAVEGRTLEEVMSLKSDSAADLTTGCTISLDPLQHAVAKAVLQAAEQPLTADHRLNLKLKAGVTAKEGGYDVTIDAAAVAMAEDKATACMVDCVTGTLSAEVGNSYDNRSKRELGYAYGMAAVTGKLEWFEQMDALQAEVVGKTAAQVSGLLAENGKIDPSLDLASKATVYIGGQVALIVAAMSV